MSTIVLKDRDPATSVPGSERLRRCLMCGKDFPSFGPGNRICKKCRSSKAWRTG